MTTIPPIATSPTTAAGSGAPPAPRPTLTLQLANFGQPGDAGLVDALLMAAGVADEVGVDRVLVVDHVVMGDRLEAYDGGRFPTGPDGQWPEPMTLLAAMAATTGRVRLGTNILIAPLRRPATLAKAAATLDVISHGRLELGVGVGWQRAEYEANGVPFEDRGHALDRTLEVCRRLWQPGPVSLTGADCGLAAERVWCEPRPVQSGGVPLWISGRIHARTLRRIVRYGDGWVPWGEYRQDIGAGIRRVHEALAEAGRDPATFQVRGTLRLERDGDGAVDADATVAPVPGRVAAGVTDFALGFGLPRDRSQLADRLAPVVEAFAVVTGRSEPSPS